MIEFYVASDLRLVEIIKENLLQGYAHVQKKPEILIRKMIKLDESMLLFRY